MPTPPAIPAPPAGTRPFHTRRRRQLCVAAFALGVLALAGCREEAAPGAGTAAARPEVGVVVLHPQSVAITAELPGRTSASLVAEVRPQVGGLIQKRLFREGTEVAEGDALYQIDPKSFEAAYDAARAALKQAQSQVPSASSRLERYKGLIRQNAVSKQDLDDAEATLESAQASVAAAEADVQTAKINLDYTTIRAPISGRIDKSALTPGALVTASQDTALTTIRRLDPINVDIPQSSTNFLNLRQAVQEGRLRTEGPDVSVSLLLENGTEYPLKGHLEFAEANVDESTGTFILRAEFPNPDRLLLPGVFVRAVIGEGVADNSFLVPQRAVTRNTKGQPVALFVSAEGKVEQRVVQTGRSVGNNWLVNTGISDGERVIVDGLQRASDGQQVKAVEVTIDETTGEVIDRKTAETAPAQPGSEG
ncbi:efflux RND transporter periplasmic adaptor subunit [Paroceanicella profunda]|uniref:Efflux RND transporter periplasmic adaptor subunit n=1 Tax=Paroceanicella profunda TaxID=2579971 RepID=A0A5B8FGW6_9RHOB|nr:efflux RND transporter periplasmic adaptor subunit [Paroceanicella profunda]QDL91477.1 efflux RND transporter periplasmic adaptor subunit [Paroceanicella profunda]